MPRAAKNSLGGVSTFYRSLGKEGEVGLEQGVGRLTGQSKGEVIFQRLRGVLGAWESLLHSQEFQGQGRGPGNPKGLRSTGRKLDTDPEACKRLREKGDSPRNGVGC